MIGRFGLGPGGPVSRHLGDSVSALLDDQLDEAAAERAWAHALACSDCRRLVEREGWVKTRLASVGGGEPSPGLVDSLRAMEAWAAVEEIEERHRGRRIGLAVAGAGSVSAAVLGIATLGGAPLGIGHSTPGAPASLTVRPSASAIPSAAPITPARYDERSRLP